MTWNKIKSAFGFGTYPEGEKQIAISDDWTLMARGRDLASNNHHHTDVIGNQKSLWDNSGLTTMFYTPDEMTNQPTSYGNLLTIAQGTEVSQLWFTHSNGSLYHRQGNANGWSGSADQAGDDANQWIKILDESNLSGTLSNSLTQSMMLKAYPVGSVYMSTSSTSPASLFGGTWTQITDRFLVGQGSTYTSAGGTGGTRSYALRALIGACNGDIASLGYITSGTTTYQANNAAGYTLKASSNLTFSKWSHSTPVTTTTSTSTTTTIEPPYFVVYMWRRTA